jgi:adenine/guanine/hypoxanthine permease
MVKQPKRTAVMRKTESQSGMLERYFGLSQQGTDVRTEFIAGITTFLTMVYIVFVNPIILGKTGMDQGAVFVATCVAAAVSTLVMGLYANYPIALAPGMGINAFFAFTVVLTYNYSWQQALAAVFCSGVLFFLISVFPIRQYVIDAIPQNLKLAVSAGVGLFLGIIALEEAKVIVDHPATLVTLGDLTKPVPVLMLLGFAAHSRAELSAHPGRNLDRHSCRYSNRLAVRASPVQWRCFLASLGGAHAAAARFFSRH